MKKIIIIAIDAFLAFCILWILNSICYRLYPDEELQYEYTYPLGVNPTKYDEFWYDDDYN